MATLNLTKTKPLPYTFINSSPQIGSTYIEWEARPNVTTVIYTSSTPSFADAIVFAPKEGNSHITRLQAGGVRYFWIAPVNTFGVEGDRFPTGNGFAAYSIKINNGDVGNFTEPLELVALFPESLPSGIVTAYNTWNNILGTQLSFTAPEEGLVNVSLSVGLTVTNATATDNLRGIARFRIYDVNNTMYIPGSQYSTFFWKTSSTVKANTGVVSFNGKFLSGFRGELMNNRPYRVHCQLQKARSSAGTFDLDYEVLSGEVAPSKFQ